MPFRLTTGVDKIKDIFNLLISIFLNFKYCRTTPERYKNRSFLLYMNYLLIFLLVSIGVYAFYDYRNRPVRRKLTLPTNRIRLQDRVQQSEDLDKKREKVLEQRKSSKEKIQTAKDEVLAKKNKKAEEQRKNRKERTKKSPPREEEEEPTKEEPAEEEQQDEAPSEE